MQGQASSAPAAAWRQRDGRLCARRLRFDLRDEATSPRCGGHHGCTLFTSYAVASHRCRIALRSRGALGARRGDILQQCGATRYHTFRHTFSTLYLEQGGSIQKLSRELGHSKISVIENYIKTLPLSVARQDHEAYSLVRNLKLNGRRKPTGGRAG
jgi:integrase